MHAIAAHLSALLRLHDGEIVLDDAGVDRLAKLMQDAVARGEAFDAVDAILTTATVLLAAPIEDDAAPSGRSAARTLLAFVLTIQPMLQRLDARRAESVQARADDLGGRFARFADEQRPTGVLGGVPAGGARPAGTTAASPLARFTMQVPARKPAADQD